MEKEFKVPYDELKSYGISENFINQEEVKEALITGKKTPMIEAYTDLPNGRSVPVPMRIQLYGNEDCPSIAIHCVRNKVKLGEYCGSKFSPTEMAKLLNGDTFMKELQLGDKTKVCLVGIDRETKEICHIPPEYIYIPDKLLGAEVSEKVKYNIRQGGKEFFPCLEKDGKTFPSIVSYDFTKNSGNGGLAFKTPTPQELEELREEQGKNKGAKEEHVGHNCNTEKQKKSPTPETTTSETKQKGKGRGM